MVQDPPIDETGRQAKRAYSAPVIEELGTLADLTAGGGPAGAPDDPPFIAGTLQP